MGFEPMCRKPDNRISSAARYDHFDIFPYLILSCVIEKNEMRFTTAKATPLVLRRAAPELQARYDHFDLFP